MAKTTARTAGGVESGSIGKALAVLRCFVDGQEEWGVRELAAVLGQPGSSVHRLLQILAVEGLVDWDPASQKYRVGMEFYRISAVLSRRLPVKEMALPIMADLVAQVEESAWLAVYDAPGRRILYVAEAECHHPLRFAARIGRQEALTESASGRAVLAFLSAEERQRVLDTISPLLETELGLVRSRGYAVVRSSHPETAIGIAAPVLGIQDRAVGAFCVIVPLHRFGDDSEAFIGEAVAAHARRLSHYLGSRLLGGGGAGTWNLGLGVMANLVRRRVPGAAITPSLGAGNKNVQDLQQGLAAYCLAVAGSLEAAFLGTPPYRNRHDRLRAMFSVFPLHLHLVARPGVAAAGVRDLVRLRVSPGERAFTTAYVFEQLLRLAGITPRDFERAGGGVVHLDYAEANRQLREGKLDVVMSLTGSPNPPYREMEGLFPLTLVGIEPDLLQRFVAANPAYTTGLIPGAAYPTWGRDTPTLLAPTVMVTTADRAEEEVYQVTRAIFEQRHEMVLAAPAYREFGPDFVLQGIRVPLHPGAARYWQEVGVLPAG